MIIGIKGSWFGSGNKGIKTTTTKSTSIAVLHELMRGQMQGLLLTDKTAKWLPEPVRGVLGGGGGGSGRKAET